VKVLLKDEPTGTNNNLKKILLEQIIILKDFKIGATEKKTPTL
jgi:hypothetical protein